MYTHLISKDLRIFKEEHRQEKNTQPRTTNTGDNYAKQNVYVRLILIFTFYLKVNEPQRA